MCPPFMITRPHCMRSGQFPARFACFVPPERMQSHLIRGGMVAVAGKWHTYSPETRFKAVARGGGTAGRMQAVGRYLRLCRTCAWLGNLFSGQPLYRRGRRRTGVKMAGGTARDGVFPLVAVEAAGQPDAGSRLPKGPLSVASSTRVSFFRSPPAPRAVPPLHASRRRKAG